MRSLPLLPSLLLTVVISLIATTVKAQPNPHYVALLNDSMWFYEAQQSGRLPSTHRVPWRGDSALNDGSDNNIDLVGGYYDAGDYLKFTLPLSHSIALIAWGGIEWFDGYQKANQTEYLRNTVRWGTDWLMKAHPSDNELYVQVGDGEIDNNYWGPDTGIPSDRPSYKITSDAPGTDIAALTAAAFAASSYLFRNQLNDTSYADALQSHAESLYNFAETAQPMQLYTEAVSASKDYYEATTYTSPLVFAALWLFRATGNTSYRDKASNYFDQFKLGSMQVDVMDWSDQTGAVYVLGAQLDGSNTKYKDAAKKYLDTLINGGDPCSYTSGGLLWCGGDSDLNSLVPAQDTALLALLYGKIDSPEADYTDFATSQIKYMLGDNRMLTPYVCGVHMNSPHNPHHAGASGGTDISNIETSPPEEKYLLYGAIVGGPDQEDKFYDERNDWAQTEVALDYNAPFLGLIARQLSADTTEDPPYVSITEPRPYVTRSVRLEKWLVAVIVIVCIFVVAGLLYLCWCKRHAMANSWRAKQNNKAEAV
ncbi:Six-hairpin glycosidase-like protein [Zychaea mexicana]|uniref:Six-hairpin glycosidase-like protein n=1 Tax=Zychaea mexicana TaxID=64656 RepID=UPI0022FE6CF2|nr:Six-hairpin glycosidase-like protein [Zychaea mexicana]KAI9493008.1 Six-hairpin glycosidase-like protein [Zychaea mexicana]